MARARRRAQLIFLFATQGRAVDWARGGVAVQHLDSPAHEPLEWRAEEPVGVLAVEALSFDELTTLPEVETLPVTATEESLVGWPPNPPPPVDGLPAVLLPSDERPAKEKDAAGALELPGPEPGFPVDPALLVETGWLATTDDEVVPTRPSVAAGTLPVAGVFGVEFA
jgi:hypothetical protein